MLFDLSILYNFLVLIEKDTVAYYGTQKKNNNKNHSNSMNLYDDIIYLSKLVEKCTNCLKSSSASHDVCYG